MNDRYVVVDLKTGLLLGRYQAKGGYKLTQRIDCAQVYTNMHAARNAILRVSRGLSGFDLRVSRLLDGERTEILDLKFKRGAKSRPVFIFSSDCREDFGCVQACARFLKISDERVYTAIRQGTALDVSGVKYYADYAI